MMATMIGLLRSRSCDEVEWATRKNRELICCGEGSGRFLGQSSTTSSGGELEEEEPGSQFPRSQRSQFLVPEAIGEVPPGFR